MTYNITIECPDCVSLTDAEGLFSYLITAIQDLELETAVLQHDLVTLSRPVETEQLQLYGRCSYLPDLLQDPALCRLLAFRDISIEDWQERVEQHLQDLEETANGDYVVATDIL